MGLSSGTGVIDPLTLRFRERELERSYLAASFSKNRKTIGAGLILGSLAFALYFIVDYLALGHVEMPIVYARFLGFPLSNLLLGIWMKYGRIEVGNRLDLIGSIYILMGQFWQFFVAFLYPEFGPYYLFAFLLLSLYAQTSVNAVSFRFVLPSIVLILLTFQLKIFVWDTHSTYELVLQSMVSAMCIFLVLRSTYLIEKGHRTDYLQQIDLERRQQELVAKNKELEQFAYIASHDLQEPLRSITSFSGLLADEYRDQLDDSAGRYLDYLLEASNRMRNLIKGLLDYSRLGRELDLGTVNVDQVLQAVRVDLSVAIQESGAELTSGKLPQIKAYETEFRQLLQNLISNAIKFRAKDVAPKIHITAKQTNNFWEFSVQDNGIGIAPENHDKIFLIFQRLHTRSVYEGTGIGLANCRKIVELHGGSIRVESAKGEGSNFIFTIPIR